MKYCHVRKNLFFLLSYIRRGLGLLGKWHCGASLLSQQPLLLWFPNKPVFVTSLGGLASSPTQPPFLPTTPEIVTWKLKFPSLEKSVTIFPTQIPSLKNVTKIVSCDIFQYEKLSHKNKISRLEKFVSFFFSKKIFSFEKCHTKEHFMWQFLVCKNVTEK